MDFIFDNNLVQGTGHLAQAYANLTLRQDFKGAYDSFTTAVALFKVSDIVPKVMGDVEAKVAELNRVVGQ